MPNLTGLTGPVGVCEATTDAAVVWTYAMPVLMGLVELVRC